MNIVVLALDVFVILCFVMVFLAFLEFALINFLSIFITRMRSRDLIREPFISTHSRIIIVGPSVDGNFIIFTRNNYLLKFYRLKDNNFLRKYF